MKKLTALDILTTSPIVPVIAIQQIKDAIPLAQALVNVGVKVLEVPLSARLQGKNEIQATQKGHQPVKSSNIKVQLSRKHYFQFKQTKNGLIP
ncbi:MAG: hypothetical protein SOX56_06360 [[Pasteurella] mairii]|uniref:Keto-hydroxyglutarate-aldolase/keto-deoxy-phosphogluconate aldolase n=1 Tax=[Pasteurella] mairii TaxID=757 RepID=A0A379B6X5_9PAST|nr:hypothetical protein [[Pasteurella] mairii]SUB34373.1 keto-hydroxyglutarate-aldolase/keto-deoxy-phosphogluconate aldolase [[Pasteurella] mairii]